MGTSFEELLVTAYGSKKQVAHCRCHFVCLVMSLGKIVVLGSFLRYILLTFGIH